MKKKTRRVLAMVLVMAMALQQSGTLGVLAVETEPEPGPAAIAETSVDEAETQGAVAELQLDGDEAETVPETQDSESGALQTAESETAAGETIPEEQQTQAATDVEERVTETATDSLDAEAGTPTEAEAAETEAAEPEIQTETGITEQATETEIMTEAATETAETLGETEMETEPVSEETEPAVAEPQTYKYEDSKVVIKVAVPEDVELPYGAELKAEPVLEGSKEYAAAAAAVEAANPDIVFHEHVFYDIYFVSDGKEVEPAGGEVSVQIKLKDAMKTDTNTSGEPAVTVSHMKDDGSLEDVTDEIDLNKKDEVKSVRFSTDSFSIMGISTGVKDGYKTDDTLDDYSLEFLLRNFNLVSFGNVDLAVHCMGGILVEGNLSGSASGFADSAYVTEESFVKGYVSFTGKCNSRNNYHPDGWAFYVGAGNAENANEITADSDGNYTVLNGMGGFNSRPDDGCGPVLMNDDYVDWTKLFNSVDGKMDTLAAKSMNTYTSEWDWSEVTIPAGTIVSLKTNGHKVKIKLEGDTAATTIINVTDGGEVIVPQVENMTSAEDGDSMSIVFTFPNAAQVDIVSELSPSFGHIIAPQATINIGSCNYNGCVIGGDMTINGEGHMWPYTGGSLIPASGGFSARKTVDGNTPAAGQTFNFSLEELKDGAWTTVETKPNDGSKVSFSKILYTDTAEHWYLISEETGTGNYEYDNALYAIHVTVEESESDGMKVYNVKDTEYYKVNNGVTKDSLVSGTGVDISKLAKVTGSDAVVFDNKELTRKEVQKVWVGDTDDVRPDSIQVQLKADGKAYGGAVTLNAGNSWHYAWENLPKYDGTREIVYTVEEAGTVAGYISTSAVDGDITTITNTYDSKDTEMHVQKVWVDGDDCDGMRPDSIQVQLYANGDTYGDAVTLDAGNGWKYDWTALPEKKDGDIVSYDVKEVGSVTGYTTAYETAGNTVTITNTHDTAKTSKSVQKVWDDDGNRDGLRPDSIGVQLLADGEPVGGTVALNADNGWGYRWNGLPVNDGGKAITYTVEEAGEVKGYTAAYAGEGDAFTITNTHETGKTKATVKKVWDDEGNKDLIRPADVTLALYADGEPAGKTVTLSEANKWTATVTDLPLNTRKDGRTAAIVYTWEEVEVPAGYEVTGNATDGTVTTITNTHRVATTTYEVEKAWVDANDKDGIRPASIGVQLMADGEACGEAVVLNAGNGWRYAWKDLPEGKGGKLIVYTVEEVSVPEGYEVSYENTEGKTVITNTHTASAEIVLAARKAFDGTLAAGQFTFKLEELGADGNTTGTTMTAVNAADGSVTFGKIVYDKPGTYQYRISEVIPKPKDASVLYDTSVKMVTVTVTEADGVLTAVSDAKDTDVTFTNRLTSVKVGKTDVTTGVELEGAHIQILDKDGKVVEEWVSGKTAHEVKGLKTGEAYTLRETVAPEGYSVTTDTVFVLKDDGSVDAAKTTATVKDGVLLVEDTLNHISLRKVDENGNSLAGAKLIVKDTTGAAVSEAWVSTKAPHEITGLAGGDYVLSEIEAPAGYRVAADVPFTVTGMEKAGTVIDVVMADTRIPENDKRSLTVTKHLMLDGIQAPLSAREMTFYVALFSDEQKTQRVSDVKPLYFHDSASSSVTFDNLGKGTYYVGETDENGTLMVSSVVDDQLVFYPEYASDKVTFAGKRSEAGSAEFTNVYLNLPPEGFYLSGEITLTKKVLLNGKAISSNDVYYARLFSDKALTEPASDVVALDLAGGMSASVTITNLFIGTEIGESVVYYVAETDEYGNPLNNTADLAFDVSIDNQRIVLDANNSSQEAVITNSFTEETEIETEAGTEVEVKQAPQTGDNTDFMRYLILMSCSAVIAAAAFGLKYRKKKRTGN